jgi:hypothetical protein
MGPSRTSGFPRVVLCQQHSRRQPGGGGGLACGMGSLWASRRPGSQSKNPPATPWGNKGAALGGGGTGACWDAAQLYPQPASRPLRSTGLARLCRRAPAALLPPRTCCRAVAQHLARAHQLQLGRRPQQRVPRLAAGLAAPPARLSFQGNRHRHRVPRPARGQPRAARSSATRRQAPWPQPAGRPCPVPLGEGREGPQERGARVPRRGAPPRRARAAPCWGTASMRHGQQACGGVASLRSPPPTHRPHPTPPHTSHPHPHPHVPAARPAHPAATGLASGAQAWMEGRSDSSSIQ